MGDAPTRSRWLLVSCGTLPGSRSKLTVCIYSTRRPCLCFLIRHEPSNSLILFDLSLAEGWQKWLGEQAGDYEREFKVELGEPLPAQLARKGVAPEEITDIILSREPLHPIKRDRGRC